MDQEEHELLEQGVRQKLWRCRICQTPLSSEPDAIRRVIASIEDPGTSWLVRYCPAPECGRSHLQAFGVESNSE